MNRAFDGSAMFHPKTGLISCGLAIITGGITILLLIIDFFLEGGTYIEHRVGKILFVYGLIIAPILHLTGLILGIISTFFIRNSKKIFPIFGIVLNSFPLILAAVVWIFLLLIVFAVIGSGGGWT